MQPSTAGDPSTKDESLIYMDSPVGLLVIRGTAEYISAVSFTDGEKKDVATSNAPALLHTCVQQLEEYFRKEREVFDLPVKQPGTEFQQTVWHYLTTIPYGHTITYLALAKRVGNVKSIRAVGTTNGKNNLAIVVPCHRVIGSGGTLTGYAGGLWRKQWLLDHERGGLLF
ncbi:methylated-DNA--[protein]-cysteine S-methyltransferase [Chitinophaga sp. SYP-B3965]|uniref:methylated-DNA--[protein]-cysteine S-methyltransferase n=1 Tax=Chitinophaga sp. SYP-B3965 TaxID=2663120 RepID=UPI0012997F77|nr:methylated-DNA--[protein]-cysteine S-methyltransferase [Chitinophaga sp. SYP-B3965]MRG45371.1 methylated-DNA--[protein]-cysteine S-methyltransferase [Chitinophaga sp. SYP-B3965]